MQIHSVSDDCFKDIMDAKEFLHSSADPFQCLLFVSILANFAGCLNSTHCSIVSLIPLPATSTQYYDMNIFVTAFVLYIRMMFQQMESWLQGQRPVLQYMGRDELQDLHIFFFSAIPECFLFQRMFSVESDRKRKRFRWSLTA